MAKTASPGATPPGNGTEPLPDNYEMALAELETLVARMEGGALSLEDSLEIGRAHV